MQKRLKCHDGIERRDCIPSVPRAIIRVSDYTREMIQLPCSKFCLIDVCTILLLTRDVVQSAGEVVQEPVLNETIK